MAPPIQNDIYLSTQDAYYLDTSMQAKDSIAVQSDCVFLEKTATVTSKVFKAIAASCLFIATNPSDDVTLSNQYIHLEGDNISVGPHIKIAEGASINLSCKSLHIYYSEKEDISAGQELLLSQAPLNGTIVFVNTDETEAS
jgi:hypothetical protein